MAGGTSKETGPSQCKSALERHRKRERAPSGVVEASSHSNKDSQAMSQPPDVVEELDYEPSGLRKATLDDGDGDQRVSQPNCASALNHCVEDD